MPSRPSYHPTPSVGVACCDRVPHGGEPWLGRPHLPLRGRAGEQGAPWWTNWPARVHEQAPVGDTLHMRMEVDQSEGFGGRRGHRLHLRKWRASLARISTSCRPTPRVRLHDRERERERSRTMNTRARCWPGESLAVAPPPFAAGA